MRAQMSALNASITAEGRISEYSDGAYATFLADDQSRAVMTLQHNNPAVLVQALLAAAVQIAEAKPLTLVEHEQIMPSLQRLRLAAALDPSLSEVQS